MTQLFDLPPEIRKLIWNAMLGPNTTVRSGTINEQTITTVSRTCSAAGHFVYKIYHAHAHELGDTNCLCNERPFYVHNDNRPSCLAILRTSRRVYEEALPSLYERRTFNVDPNRKFVSLWLDRYCEAWFLLNRFLQGLSEDARNMIYSIQVPMLLSRFEVAGARLAFKSIARQLPNLQTVELQVTLSSVKVTWYGHEGIPGTDLHGVVSPGDIEEDNFFLGPCMAFADTKMIVTAVDKHDIEDAKFRFIKPHIEMIVWRLLLPSRVMREHRRIGRIRRALGSLDHEEVDLQSGSRALGL